MKAKSPAAMGTAEELTAGVSAESTVDAAQRHRRCRHHVQKNEGQEG